MLVITGLIRSGTSPLARMAHQMGIQMGNTQILPGPGIEAEYEDVELIAPLTQHVLGAIQIENFEDVFRRYIRKRRSETRNRVAIFGKQHIKGWGVKSPILSLFWGDLVRAARAEGEVLRVVLSYRPLSEVQKSLEVFGSRVQSPYREKYQEQFGNIQTAIREARAAIKKSADLEISLSETRGSPITAGRKIASLMGIDLENEYAVVQGIY